MDPPTVKEDINPKDEMNPAHDAPMQPDPDSLPVTEAHQLKWNDQPSAIVPGRTQSQAREHTMVQFETLPIPQDEMTPFEKDLFK